MPFANTVKSKKLDDALLIINQFAKKPVSKVCNQVLDGIYTRLVREYKACNVTPVMIANAYMSRTGIKVD